MDEPLPPNKTRIVNLDVLRGFFVSLALLQHFAYYWNIWFIDHFKSNNELISIYFQQLMGTNSKNRKQTSEKFLKRLRLLKMKGNFLTGNHLKKIFQFSELLVPVGLVNPV